MLLTYELLISNIVFDIENFVDLYTDYLITSSSYTTATGMASLLSIKHDKITQDLSKGGITTVSFYGKKQSPMLKR